MNSLQAGYFCLITTKGEGYTMQSRTKGAMFGLAIGDAMGAPVEFRPRGEFEPVTDFRPGGPFHLQAGQWTDDTAMSLCIASSLTHCQSFDATHQMEQYCRWIDEGYLSCTGKAVGIGQATLKAMMRYYRTKDPIQGDPDPRKSGNGCIMRLAPVPIYYRNNATLAIYHSIQSASTTHGSDICLQTTGFFGSMIWGALNGVSKDDLLSECYSPVTSYYLQHPMCNELLSIANGEYKSKYESEIESTGFVIDALEAALWSFYHTDSYADGLLKAVNLGGDADTVGAIYGQLAGAYYGIQAIPVKWVQGVALSEKIDAICDALVKSRSSVI
jgi:ADP-ribosyl-[dinitrogen reductase] hydrolase